MSLSLDLQLRNQALVLALCLPVAALAIAAHIPSGYAFIAGLSAAVLVIVAATDLERRIIPNKVVLPAAGVILGGQLALGPGHASRAGGR